MVPGFTTATQNSGAPFPLPILVSRGFLVKGLSGNILIHTLPSLFICLVIATLAASICLWVIQAGSIAFKPKLPKDTVNPLVALPALLPLWAFLNFTLFGIKAIKTLS